MPRCSCAGICPACDGSLHTAPPATQSGRKGTADAEGCTVLECGHVYHKECVDQWLAINHNCPACKAPIA